MSIPIVLIWNVTKEFTNLQIECEATRPLTKVALLSLNLVTITGRQCSSLLNSTRNESEVSPKLSQPSEILLEGSFSYQEFPQSYQSHPQGSLSVLLVSIAIPKQLSLYHINMRPCLSKISSLSHQLVNITQTCSVIFPNIYTLSQIASHSLKLSSKNVVD